MLRSLSRKNLMSFNKRQPPSSSSSDTSSEDERAEREASRSAAFVIPLACVQDLGGPWSSYQTSQVSGSRHGRGPCKILYLSPHRLQLVDVRGMDPQSLTAGPLWRSTASTSGRHNLDLAVSTNRSVELRGDALQGRLQCSVAGHQAHEPYGDLHILEVRAIHLIGLCRSLSKY